MVKVIAVLALISLVFAPLAMARDLGEIISTPWDTLRGENESCPMLISPYIAKTFNDMVGEADVRVELSYECDITDIDNNNQVMLKAGLEL